MLKDFNITNGREQHIQYQQRHERIPEGEEQHMLGWEQQSCQLKC